MEATHGVSARLALYNSGDHHARYESFNRINGIFPLYSDFTLIVIQLNIYYKFLANREPT